MDNKTEEEKYIPGTCNIGPEEIKRRKNSALFSAVLALFWAGLLLILHADPLWFLTLFLPLASLGISFQQWTNKFCVNFGMRGVYNFKQLGTVTRIEESSMRKADRQKAARMILIGIVFGLVLTVLCYLIARW
jgi:hypothetical protein